MAEKDKEFIILVFAGMAFVIFILPKMLPGLVAKAISYLLAWHLVVPAADAVIRIPATDVGLDVARVVLGLGLLLVLGTAVRSMVRKATPTRGETPR